MAVKRKAVDDMLSRPSKLIRSELHNFVDELIQPSDIKSIDMCNKMNTTYLREFISIISGNYMYMYTK
jgi:hypothetical protein